MLLIQQNIAQSFQSPLVRVMLGVREPLAGDLHLAAVGRPGARARIRAAARRLGLREGEDLVAVA